MLNSAWCLIDHTSACWGVYEWVRTCVHVCNCSERLTLVLFIKNMVYYMGTSIIIVMQSFSKKYRSRCKARKLLSSDKIRAVDKNNRFLDNGNFDASNSLVEVFGNDEEDNFPNLVNHSYHCTEKELLNAIKPSNGLSILTLNCQSLSAKFDELCIFLNTLEHKLYVITLQETWCCKIDQYKLCKIKDYNYIATCAKSSKHGGLITYIHKDYKFKLTSDFDDHSNLWESHFLEIAHKINTSKTIIIGNIYRPPKSKNGLLSTFINEFSSILNKVQIKESLVYICGDFNIDLLKIREKRLHSEYFDNLLSEGFHPKISLPTRLGKTHHTLIHNIITNSKDFGEKVEF